MLLLLDVGNTNIVFALWDGEKCCREKRLPTDGDVPQSTFENAMTEVLDGAVVEGAVLSSVAPQVNEKLRAAAERVTGQKCLRVTYDMKMNMPLNVDEPPTIGADLIAGCVGAMQKYPLPLVVADLGTANTVMVVNQKGEFVGGIIAPGLKMQLSSLGAGTSLLPDLEVAAPKKCIGANTVDCLESGVVYGTAAMLDGVLDRVEAELGGTLTVVATGGLSGRVVPHCRRKISLEPDLVLQGMAVLYEMNK